MGAYPRLRDSSPTSVRGLQREYRVNAKRRLAHRQSGGHSLWWRVSGCLVESIKRLKSRPSRNSTSKTGTSIRAHPSCNRASCFSVSNFLLPIILLSPHKLTISIRHSFIASSPRILTLLIERARPLASTSKAAIAIIIDCSISNGLSRNHDKISRKILEARWSRTSVPPHVRRAQRTRREASRSTSSVEFS